MEKSSMEPISYPVTDTGHKPIRILLIGEGRIGDNLPSYSKIFESMGHQVQSFDHGKITISMQESIFGKAIYKLSTWPASYLVSWSLREFLKRRCEVPVDLTLCCAPLTLLPDAIRRIKERTGSLVFTWQSADYSSPTLSSRWSVQGIPLYDCIFVHGAFDIQQVNQAGGRRVEYLPLGCNQELYCPLDPDRRESFETDVVFVGHWRPEREEALERLVAHQFPHRLAVWGYGWREGRPPNKSPLRKYVRFAGLHWNEMGPMIRRAKIALVFLTHFDTGRVVAPLRIFEIAAAGGFMLAERGNGQPLEFFHEGEEMACFGDIRELREKIDYYLAHEEEAFAIRLAGQRRAVQSGYFHSNKLQRMLEVYRDLREGDGNVA